MNRIEYMKQLAALLQDVPVEERIAAMQYYNDYFDDAGEENEAQVIAELGSPEKVAAEMKAGLGKRMDNSGEFRETGYTDTQFEEKDMPVKYRTPGQRDFEEQQSGDQYGYSGNQTQERKPWTNKWLKIALIVLIVLVGAPVLIPVAFGIICCIFALALAAFCIFFALVIAAGAVAICGIVLFIKGGLLVISSMPAAMMIMGIGLILAVLGIIATVASVRLCIIVLPGLFRFFVDLCRRPFHRRKAVA